MPFLLLNNPEISSLRWVVFIPEDPHGLHYLAELSDFKGEQNAREYCETVSGVLVPGRLWVLRFAGIANSPRYSVTLTYDVDIPRFLEQASAWCETLPPFR